jgi:hypothetical protein
VRINAILLAPILVVALLASAAADDDVRYRIQRSMTVVALAVLAIAYAYDMRYAKPYMIRQLQGKLVPRFAFDAAERWKLFEVSLQLVLAVAVLFALVLGAAHLVRVSRTLRIAPPATAFWKWAVGVVVALAIVGWVVIPQGGVNDALARWGPVLLLLAAAGIGLVVLRPGRYFDEASGLFVVLVVATYTLVFAGRLREARGAIYYLYWDRYLFSEVLPLALLLAAIALHALIGWCVAATAARPALRVAAAVGLVVLSALAIFPAALQTRDSGITRQALYGDAYDALSRLNRLSRADGPGPVVYSGSRPAPPEWFFPNTKAAFAQPLHESFNRILVGTGSFGTEFLDKERDPWSARAMLEAAGHRKGYLVSLRTDDTPRYPDDAKTRYVGSVDYEVPVLRRSLDRWSERFSTIDLHFDVYALRV